MTLEMDGIFFIFLYQEEFLCVLPTGCVSQSGVQD